MKSIVITKWVEPYVVLETFKKFFELEVLNFDGSSKLFEEKLFLKKIQKSEQFVIGIYMKNVNKFYLFTSSQDIDVNFQILEKEIGLIKSDIIEDVNPKDSIDMVDMAKAEFIVIEKD